MHSRMRVRIDDLSNYIPFFFSPVRTSCLTFPKSASFHEGLGSCSGAPTARQMAIPSKEVKGKSSLSRRLERHIEELRCCVADVSWRKDVADKAVAMGVL